MGVLLDRLAERKLLVADGAMGTMLQARGLTPGDCPEEWNLSHAGVVKEVARAYAQAGSDLLQTNTFGGSAVKLKRIGYEERLEAFNQAGARNALEAAEGAIVAGSVGPTGEFIAPLGTLTAGEIEDIFARQIDALLKAGLKAIVVETMTAVEEAACAVRATKSLDPSVDVFATFTFDTTPNGFRTMMGVDPRMVVEQLGAAGADGLGSNCGNGIDQMIEIVREFRRHTQLPLLVNANAGLPELVDGKTVFRQTPEQMAAQVDALIDAGANIIGGCCGTTPEHIAAIREVVDRRR